MTGSHHESAGAYVIGALGAAERAEFEAHLADCADCRARVTDLAGMPGLLARVSVADLADPPAAPDTLLPGLLATIRRRRRRRTTVLLAAAAAVVVALTGIGIGLVGSPPDAPPRITLAALQPGPLHADAEVTATAGGSRIALRCTYAGSDARWTGPHSRPYRLVVTDLTGSRSTVASWRVGPDHVVSVNGSVGVPPSQIATIEVSTADGTPVLRWASRRS